MQTDLDQLTPMVERFLRVDDITTGDEKKGYLARYRGQLRGSSEEVYDELSHALLPHDVTPLFRMDGDRHSVLLVPGINHVERSNPWINLLMFALTLISVGFVGSMMNNVYNPPEGIGQLILGGLPFAFSLLAILLAHEFGHYLAARYHRTQVTLPYFIPLPISLFGTMGAFIRLKEPPKNKRILLDIGIAGPIAGLVVAIPILLLGLSLSRVDTINVAPGAGLTLEGNSLLYLLAKYMVFGQLLPAPASYAGVPPLLYWLRYYFTSQPLPLGGVDVLIHPVAWAGWAGLLVTALNLIPAGQLDGGHVLYVLLGKRARLLWPIVLIFVAVLGFFWSGWWLWAFIILLLGRIYAEPLDQITQLDPPRRALALFGIVLFFLVFTPVPFVAIQTITAGMF